MFLFFFNKPENDIFRIFKDASQHTKLFFYPPQAEPPPYEFRKSHRWAEAYSKAQAERDAAMPKPQPKYYFLVGDKIAITAKPPVDVVDFADLKLEDVDAAIKAFWDSVEGTPISKTLEQYYRGDKDKMKQHVKCPLCEAGVPKTLVAIKPDPYPMKMAHGVSEGIEPTFQDSYRMRKYEELQWRKKCNIPPNPIGEEIVLPHVYESTLGCSQPDDKADTPIIVNEKK